jgi:carbon monoxide dehydrogenase subunit G
VPGRPIIRYRNTHRFALDPARLWKELEDVGRFEHWWSWLEEFSLEGDGLSSGSVLHGVVAPPLPYRMRIQVELVRCVPESEIDALVHGDLEGEAQLRLSPEGTGTAVEAAWVVEMMQRPMRLASRVAHPVLQWGHDRVVEITVNGFRRHVESGS